MFFYLYIPPFVELTFKKKLAKMEDTEHLQLLIDICDRIKLDIKVKNAWIIGEKYNLQEKINNATNHIKYNCKKWNHFKYLIVFNNKLIATIKNNIKFKEIKHSQKDIKKIINIDTNIKNKIRKKLKQFDIYQHIGIMKDINEVNTLDINLQEYGVDCEENIIIDKVIEMMAEEDIFSTLFNIIINNHYTKNEETYAEPILIDGKIVWYKKIKE